MRFRMIEQFYTRAPATRIVASETLFLDCNFDKLSIKTNRVGLGFWKGREIIIFFPFCEGERRKISLPFLEGGRVKIDASPLFVGEARFE